MSVEWSGWSEPLKLVGSHREEASRRRFGGGAAPRLEEVSMRGMARVGRWACAVALLTAACSSSNDKNGGGVVPGGGPFGNVTQGGKGSGSGGKGGKDTSGSSGKGGSLPDGQCANGLAHTTRVTPRVM